MKYKFGLRIVAPLALLILVALSAQVLATSNTKLDVFRDCDIGGCTAANPLDMIGPGDQGFVNYNQDGETGDLRVVVNLHKSGAANTTYRVFLVCGPGGVGTPHSESCGFIDIGSVTTNGSGNGNSSALIVPKCDADALISGNAFSTGQQAHIDLLVGVGDQSQGSFVATPIDFDPSVGPACALLGSAASPLSSFSQDPAR